MGSKKMDMKKDEHMDMDMGEHAHAGAEEEQMFGKLTLDAVPYHEPIGWLRLPALS